MIGDIAEAIWGFLYGVWDYIKKIWVKILNFFGNVVSFFRDQKRLQKLRHDQNVLAVALKQNLDNGNYNVCTCLFDKNAGEVVDYQEDSCVYNAENIDDETRRRFGDKDMIILK